MGPLLDEVTQCKIVCQLGLAEGWLTPARVVEELTKRGVADPHALVEWWLERINLTLSDEGVMS